MYSVLVSNTGVMERTREVMWGSCGVSPGLHTPLNQMPINASKFSTVLQFNRMTQCCDACVLSLHIMNQNQGFHNILVLGNIADISLIKYILFNLVYICKILSAIKLNMIHL